MAQLYVGWNGNKYEPFRSKTNPTQESHGKTYSHVVGPFRTKAGATFFSERSIGNPHVQCAADADRIAKEIGWHKREDGTWGEAA